MTKKEAYRAVHGENNRFVKFNHSVKGIAFTGSFYQSDQYPFKTEISARKRNENGREERVIMQARSMEDAVVWLFNGFNSDPTVSNKYHSLEDIIFEGGKK